MKMPFETQNMNLYKVTPRGDSKLTNERPCLVKSHKSSFEKRDFEMGLKE